MLKEIEIYGHNFLIRDHTGYPPWLFLPCHSDHGIMMKGEVLETDLKTNKPLMLVNARYTYDLWKEKSAIPAVLSGSVFVHFRRKHGIEKERDARGTVAFPSHTTASIDTHFDIEKYCEELKSLPHNFQPVTVCVHWSCMKKGRDSLYRNAGLDVTCAGHYREKRFAESFYNILKRHKYSTSNLIGSYAFYSVEMDIPFFLLGEDPTFTSSGEDINVPKGDYTTEFIPGLEIVRKAFSTGPVRKTTREQRELVEEATGINDCVPPEELKRVLLETFKKHYLKTYPWYMLKRFIRKPKVLFEWLGLSR